MFLSDFAADELGSQYDYRYIGQSAAAEMHKAELALEEYLRACLACDTTMQCGSLE
jgi:hypothetical protein